MKKLSLLFLSLLLGLAMAAAPVSEETAKSIAESFLRRPAAARLILKEKVPTTATGSRQRIALKASESEAPAYYVFNFDGGGFIIVAGDDAVEPVLGYSRTGHISADNMSPQLRWWMDGVASEIGMIRSGAASPRPDRRKAWVTPRKYGAVQVQHETAKWGQDTPYNNECPMVGKYNGRTVAAVTGCVATAGAIVARFYRWPDAGEGTLPSYSYTSDDSGSRVTIPSFTLGRTYDWANMRLSYGSSYTTAEANAVAALMVDIGKASAMAYNYDYGSGTFDQNLLEALLTHFKYNKKAYQAPREGYTDDEWISLLKKNLDVGPIPYGGVAGDDGGHEFVFDGYTVDNYFSVNWGWEGDGDGFFLVNRLTLDSYTFSDYQSALLDLYPDRDGTTTFSDDLILTPTANYGNGLTTSATSFSTGTTFTVNVKGFYNNGIKPFTGNCYIALYDKKGNWKENVSSAKAYSNLLNPYIEYQKAQTESSFNNQVKTWTNISCRITGTIKGGDRLRFHYEGQYSSGWARCDQECPYEIIVAEDKGATAEEIAAATSFTWVRGSRKFILKTTLDGISMTMKNASGAHIFSQDLTAGTATSFDCAELPSGTYSVTLSDGEDYVFTLNL